MFKNIGEKIKKLAEIFTIIGIVCAVLSGIVVMSFGDGFVLIGFIVIALMSFLAWIGSFLLYGYGQLIDNTDKLVKLHTGESDDQFAEAKDSTQTLNTDSEDKNLGKCDICGKENIPVSYCTIKDDLGTRYRYMCEDCAKNYNN